jgi:hypothetical protein
MRNKEKNKIIIGNKIYTRRALFEKKNAFHREQATLSFEEKIKRVVDLQNIVRNIPNPQAHKIKVWNLK